MMIFIGAIVLGLYLIAGHVEPSTHDLLMVALIGLIVVVVLPQVI